MTQIMNNLHNIQESPSNLNRGIPDNYPASIDFFTDALRYADALYAEVQNTYIVLQPITVTLKREFRESHKRE